MSQNLPIQTDKLSEDNLLATYLIEDKLQSNFKKINQFMLESKNFCNSIGESINTLTEGKDSMREDFLKRLNDLERKILNETSMELDGRIAISVNKNFEAITQRIEEKERKISNANETFNNQQTKLKEELKFELLMEIQKTISNELKKLPSSLPAQKLQFKAQKNDEKWNENWQDEHIRLLEIESKIGSLEEFCTSVDKRVYSGITSIKESWKEISSNFAETQKSLNKKVEELKYDFIKMKNSKDFLLPVTNVEEHFKTKVSEKFIEIYQMIGKTVTKGDFELNLDRLSSQIERHDDEFMEIRNELATNNSYFTFYANNYDHVDLKKQIDEANALINTHKTDNEEKWREFNQQKQEESLKTKEMKENMKEIENDQNEKMKVLICLRDDVKSLKERIESLEDFNHFGPEKLEKIHAVLDSDLSLMEKELVESKYKRSNIVILEQNQKDLKAELNRVKDELFIVTSEASLQKDKELSEVKKLYKDLEIKLEKWKAETEEKAASRKPWNCMSCERQDKEKELSKKEAREARIKKAETFRGFEQQKSERNIKINSLHVPPFDERFEVYDKMKEKYLSDTLKLPELFKEKLKEKEKGSTIYK